MKTTKLFFMAALSLLMAACSNEDNEMAQQAEQPDNNMITITATLAPKSSDAQTRAVSYDGTKVVVDWAVGEHLAILYEVSSVKKLADAEITAVDGTGTATITFAVDGSTTDGTACTIVYPLAAAKADYSGVKAYADMLATQDGTLNANLDVRVGAGKIMTGTPDLDVTTQPAAQYSIFRFTLRDLSGTNKFPTQFIVSDNSGNVITTATAGSFPFHVALPALTAGTYWFNATISGEPYIAKATLSSATVAGKFYPSIVKMATIGNVIGDDGKFYADKTAAQGAGSSACAVIAYLGSETVETGYPHGLAIAMKDANNASGAMWMYPQSAVNPTRYPNIADALAAKESGSSLSSGKNNSTYPAFQAALANSIATETGISAAAPATGTSGWFMPSIFQWNQIVNGLTGTTDAFAAGGYNHSLDNNAVNPKITAAGGTGLKDGNYWSSTEYDSDYAWKYEATAGDVDAIASGAKGSYTYVRAAFAF